MVAVWMLLLFVAVVLLAWWLLFEDARARVAARFARRTQAWGTPAARGWSRATTLAQAFARQWSTDTGSALRTAHRYRGWLLGAVALALVPPLLILGLRQRVQLDGYDVPTVLPENDHVLELLRGERLAPPLPLPPEVFLAADAAQVPGEPAEGEGAAPARMVTADRRWERIHPEFQQRVLALFRVMEQRYGYRMVLVEGFRSAQRQAELAARGGGVTRAVAGQSCHQHGLAVDSALYRDGKLHWDMRDPWVRRGYFLYGELAQQVGLEWGGRWRSLKDYVHVEWKAPCRDARRAARVAGG